jgi:hypothetical protein
MQNNMMQKYYLENIKAEKLIEILMAEKLLFHGL